MSATSDETPIYFEEISRWRATHHGRMPGAARDLDEATGHENSQLNDLAGEKRKRSPGR